MDAPRAMKESVRTLKSNMLVALASASTPPAYVSATWRELVVDMGAISVSKLFRFVETSRSSHERVDFERET